MKKKDFKKLAVLGVTGMLLTSAQAKAEQTQENNTTLAASCGGKNGCAGSAHRSSCGGQTPPQYTADAQTDMINRDRDFNQQGQRDQNQGRMMTESELMSQLNEQGKATYRGLDPEGKALALKLAASNQFSDKNQAIDTAARRMAEKRASMGSNRPYSR